MGKKDKKIRELQFTLEALEDELVNREEMVQMKQKRIVELIRENDRLTLTYEPFNPEGSEGHGHDFYGLLEENNSLTENILDKIEVIKEQDDEIETLNNRILRQKDTIRYQEEQISRLTAPKKKYPKAGVVSLDVWPPSDWFRLSLDKWNPGKYFQLCIGPLRIDWFAS